MVADSDSKNRAAVGNIFTYATDKSTNDQFQPGSVFCSVLRCNLRVTGHSKNYIVRPPMFVEGHSFPNGDILKPFSFSVAIIITGKCF